MITNDERFYLKLIESKLKKVSDQFLIRVYNRVKGELKHRGYFKKKEGKDD